MSGIHFLHGYRDIHPGANRRRVKPIQSEGGGAISLGSAGAAELAAPRCVRAHSSGNNSAKRSAR
jgi:hypothetical protein